MNYKCTYTSQAGNVFTSHHDANSPEHAAEQARFYRSLPNGYPVTAEPVYDAETLLDAALAEVESVSIREWAQCERATWIKIVEVYLAKVKEPKPESLAAVIALEAIRVTATIPEPDGS